MPPTVVWLLLFLTLAAIFFAAEMFIPSHGLLSVLAIACLLGVIGLCFVVDRWLGFGAMLALILLGPVGISTGLSLWKRTSLGRRVVLHATTCALESPPVLVGSVGKTMTELRPMGECEFGDRRVEVRGEMGQLIPPGTAVQVIAMHGRIATVRPVAPIT